MGDELIWRQIARHLEGRSANQVKNRFLRDSSNPTDFTLRNISKHSADPTNPVTYNHDLCHVYALTVVPKAPFFLKALGGNQSSSSGARDKQEVTAKLQHEVRFLVCGTLKEIFLLPCGETAIRCHHSDLTHTTFHHDPSRPAMQFETFVKLTFSNGLKKAGLVEDPESFHFNSIAYRSGDIHSIMSKAEEERFVVPKDVFMELNRRVEGLVAARDGSLLSLKRKYNTNSGVRSNYYVTPVPRITSPYDGPKRPRGRPPGATNRPKHIYENLIVRNRSRSPSPDMDDPNFGM